MSKHSPVATTTYRHRQPHPSEAIHSWGLVFCCVPPFRWPRDPRNLADISISIYLDVLAFRSESGKKPTLPEIESLPVYLEVKI